MSAAMADRAKVLNKLIQGDVCLDEETRALYAQDASVYQQLPQAVIVPYTSDIQTIIRFAYEHNMPLIPRSGGTSLAGQLVGEGWVIDLSKHQTQIIEINVKERYAIVETGVIRDDLNRQLEPYGLLFAPETSTSNRCTIGGMVGNNACGVHSIYYGTTRDHILACSGFLSDGSAVCFQPISDETLQAKCQQSGLEGDIYRQTTALLEAHRQTIAKAHVDPSLIRNNSGYALQAMEANHAQKRPFSMIPLICGSEGTLAVVTQIKVKLTEAPKFKGMLCPHFNDLAEAINATQLIVSFEPSAVELFDQATLDAGKHNRIQNSHRFWIEGNPKAVQVIEIYAQTSEILEQKMIQISDSLQDKAYACPRINADDYDKVWQLRSAALGLLMGKPGENKAIAVIEDAAIPLPHLSTYIQLMLAYAKQQHIGMITYGHSSVGVIHLRPELDLTQTEAQQKFKALAQYSAQQVKQFNGALSGEHGDGRLRGQWLELIYGTEFYKLLEQVKKIFDDKNILNPGKITQTPPMTAHLRPALSDAMNQQAAFDWQVQGGFSGAVDKCNGAGACRKSSGLMCPSYQATKEESMSTRGRANLLRFALSRPNPQKHLSQPLLKKALDLCLACKGCLSECPASVDMAKLKAEVLYLRAQSKALSWSEKKQNWLVEHYPQLIRLQQNNGLARNLGQSAWVKRLFDIDERRPLPQIASRSFQQCWQDQSNNADDKRPKVGLLVDLFANHYEPHIAIDFVKLLNQLGFQVQPLLLEHSPRLLISTGLLKQAKQCLSATTSAMQAQACQHWLGIEPSEVLVFRDDAVGLIGVDHPKIELIDEWLPGVLNKAAPFKAINKKVYIHHHCHQKSLAGVQTAFLAMIPELTVKPISVGCCGMAGQFGYRHYDVSKKIAESGLIQAVERMEDDAILVAAGTSCRQQIADFSHRQAIHPITLLVQSLNKT